MNIQTLRIEAHTAGVMYPEYLNSEQTLVRSIQKAQGHSQCFQSERRYFCKKNNCPWTSDCKKLIAEWMR